MTRLVEVRGVHHAVSACVAMLLAAVVFTSTRIEAQCMGDCLGDGQVTVDELMTMANIALAKMPMTMCEPGDANGDGRMGIDEILAGVNHVLTGCPAVSPKLEKAAGVASSTLVALLVFLTDIPAIGPDSDAAATAARARALPRAAESCPAGGTVSVSCQESGGNSTLTASFSKCGIPDEATGLVMISNGKLVAVVAARGVCSSGVIPGNVRITTQFTSFSAIIKDSSSGAEITNVSLPSFSEAIDPTGEGCVGPDGTYTLNGSFAVTTLDAGVDLSGKATKLALQITSSGAPCVLQLIANGSLDLTDKGNNRHFTASFASTHATLQEGPDGTMLGALDGEVTASCVGKMTLTTDEPLGLLGGGCPVDGQLSVAFADGTHGQTWFTAAGGLALDYDDDGTLDREVLDCHAASIGQCR